MKETVAKKKGTRVAGARTSDVGAYWAQVKVVVPQFGEYSPDCCCCCCCSHINSHNQVRGHRMQQDASCRGDLHLALCRDP